MIAVTKHALTNRPSLNFIAVSQDDPDDGGCAKVVAMVRKFGDSVVGELIHGLIDLDAGNQPSPNVSVLSRYSIENYLYDPLVIATALVRDGNHKILIPSTETIDTGELQDLFSSATRMQQAIDEVLALIAGMVSGDLNESPVECAIYTKYGDSPMSYTLPTWFIHLKKANLLLALRSPQQPLNRHITTRNQYLALESAGLVFGDVHSILTSLAS